MTYIFTQQARDDYGSCLRHVTRITKRSELWEMLFNGSTLIVRVNQFSNDSNFERCVIFTDMT